MLDIKPSIKKRNTEYMLTYDLCMAFIVSCLGLKDKQLLEKRRTQCRS